MFKFHQNIKLRGLYHRGPSWQNRLFLNGKELDPTDSLRLRNHSPSGFNWGYGGSGPAQSALAVCLELFPPVNALRWYQEFKFCIIAGLPQSEFSQVVDLAPFWSRMGPLELYKLTVWLIGESTERNETTYLWASNAPTAQREVEYDFLSVYSKLQPEKYKDYVLGEILHCEPVGKLTT